MLVRMAPKGLAAGELAERIGLPASTLSFHLQHLVHAELIQSERRSRSLVYSLRVDCLQELFWFLGEDCCQGRTDLCTPFTSRIEERLREAKTSSRPAVLFVCSGNSARSQMAEALLRRDAGDRFDIYSGGLKPQEIHPLTLRVLDEIGIATAGLRSKDLGQFLGKVTINYAVIVCEAAHDDCPRLHPFSVQQMYWPFADPAAAQGTEDEQLSVFREVRDAIAGRVQHWLQEEMA